MARRALSFVLVAACWPAAPTAAVPASGASTVEERPAAAAAATATQDPTSRGVVDPGPALGSTLLLAAGTALRPVADLALPATVVLPEASEVTVIDHHGSWVRVDHHGTSGWILPPAITGAGAETIAAAPGPPDPPAEPAATGRSGRPVGDETAGTAAAGTPSPPFGTAAPATVALPPSGLSAAEAARLERAMARLGTEARRRRAGPFELFTDVGDEELLEGLQRLAEAAVHLYGRRYGLSIPPVPATDPASPVRPPSAGFLVLFRDEADLHALGAAAGGAATQQARTERPSTDQPRTERARTERARVETASGGADGRQAGDTAPGAATPSTVIVGEGAPGETVGRVALLHLGDRTAADLSRLFVHELVHLLNRYALGPEPPAWLDEGLAGDLELFPMPGDGTLREVPLDFRAVRLARADRAYGPLVALERLVADARRGRLESLEELATLSGPELRASPRSAELYALAALWVRFLLDGGEAERAAAFRGWLAEVAAGSEAVAPRLEVPHPDGEAAGVAAGRAERDLRRWLADLHRRVQPTRRR